MSTSRALIREIPASEFQAEVLDRSHEVPVIVDFWAPWCTPCLTLGPALEQAVQARGGAVELVKLNVDEAPELAQQLGISGIPAVKAYRDGQVTAEFVGVQPPDVLDRWVSGLVPSQGEQVLSAAREAAEAGRGEEAIGALQRHLENEPRDHAVRLELGRLLAKEARLDEAAQVLRGVESGASEEDEARRELVLVEMAREGSGGEPDAVIARAGEHPEDVEVRFAAAGAAWRAGRGDEAVEHLLEAVRIDRSYRDEAPRKALLAIFDHLGHEHPVVQSGRRRLAMLLY
jgi:putative thioredoxin